MNLDTPRPPRYPDHPPAPGAPRAPAEDSGDAAADDLAGATREAHGVRAAPPARLRPPVWLTATLVLVLVGAMGLVLGATGRWVTSGQAASPTTTGFVHVEEVPSEDGGLVAAPRDPPEDAAWSEQQIRAAFDLAFDETTDPAAWAAVVDAPRITVEQLLALSARCGPASPSIESVDFTSPDDAFVRFRLVGSTVPGADSVQFTGGAVRRDGVWKVTGYTFDAVAGLGESACG